MSQRSEKYARSLDRRMATLERKMDHWEGEIASTHLAMMQDAARERNRARRDADTYRRAANAWKAVAYGALAASSLVLILAIAKTSAKAAERPQEAPLPTLSVISEVAETASQSSASAQEPHYARIIENATVTHYCVCEKCCGKTPDDPAYGITASGREAVPYYSVAVDPCLIELGSTLYLDFGDGELVECRADDTGAAVNGAHIDYCVPDHATALSLGVKTAAVYIEEVI